MPVQKLINVLKILFIALSAMFLILFVSLLNRQANAEAAANAFVDAKTLLSNIPLSPVMALIPMIICIVFTIVLFIFGAKEKKNE